MNIRLQIWLIRHIMTPSGQSSMEVHRLGARRIRQWPPVAARSSPVPARPEWRSRRQKRPGESQRLWRTVVEKAFWPYWRRIGIRVSRS